MLESLIAWFRLYAVGAFVLLLQLLRSEPLTHKNRKLQRGTTVVVSGITSGIGRALSVLLSHSGVRVLGFAPQSDDFPICISDTFSVDLSDLTSLNDITDSLRRKILSLPAQDRTQILLIHVAGTLAPNKPHDSFAVNLLAPAAITALLADLVDASVFIGSAAHAAAPIPSPPFLCPPSESRAAYPSAKLLLHAVSDALASHAHIPALVVHPGVVKTALYDGEPGVIGAVLRLLLNYVAWDAETAADRIYEIMQRAKVVGVSPNYKARAEYWDATTLCREPIPVQLLDANGTTRAEVSDGIWDEIQEFLTRIKKPQTRENGINEDEQIRPV